MDILKEISERRSIRKFKPDQVKEEDIIQLIEAARLAPSGNNSQPWRFQIIRDEKLKKRIIDADHNQQWMGTAPVFIACLADLRCRMNTAAGSCNPEKDLSEADFRRIVRDSAISITCMLLQAQHLGLGTCWTGWYDKKEMREILGLPEYYYVAGIVPVGYSDEEPEMRPRHTLEELILK